MTDLDGTIVIDGGVSAATLRAAHALRSNQIALIVATARTVAGLAVVGEMAEFIDLAVCCGGSVGYLPASARVIWQEHLAPEALRQVLSALRRELPQAGLGAFDGQHWLLDHNYRTARGKWPTGDRTAATDELIAQTQACALGICHPTMPSIAIARVLAACGIGPSLALLSSGGSDVLDVTPPGIDKGYGVRRALAYLQIDSKRAVAVGDELNDLPMFCEVGLSVAVANARAEVRDAADLVTGSAKTDGFASFVSQHLTPVTRPLATPSKTDPAHEHPEPGDPEEHHQPADDTTPARRRDLPL